MCIKCITTNKKARNRNYFRFFKYVIPFKSVYLMVKAYKRNRLVKFEAMFSQYIYYFRDDVKYWSFNSFYITSSAQQTRLFCCVFKLDLQARKLIWCNEQFHCFFLRVTFPDYVRLVQNFFLGLT